MEGGGGTLALVGAWLACLAIALAGCGSDSDGSGPDGIETRNPESTFAPLVQLAPQERWRPISAGWFLNRSALWLAEDDGCEDRKIAVGRVLKAQRNPVVDWLFVFGLGRGPTFYWRRAMTATCAFRKPYRYFTIQQTRPHDPVERVKGLHLAEGFYLDLMDWARTGPPPRRSGGRKLIDDVPVYVERKRQEVEGEPGLRLSYWMLYGMHEPLRSNRPVARLTHEGDWERVDVLLQEGDGEHEYVPTELRLATGSGQRRLPWSTFARVGDGGGGGTHPVMSAARGDHGLSPMRTASACPGCIQWRTWSRLADARKQLWYGYGGAWGDIGTTGETTGPHGPYGKLQPAEPPAGEASASDSEG